MNNDGESVTLSGAWATASLVIGLGASLVVTTVISVVLSGLGNPARRAWLEQDSTKFLVASLLILAVLAHLIALVLGIAFRRTWQGKVAMLSPLLTVVLWFLTVAIFKSRFG